MPKERKITDLEGAVLGVVGVKGPCTPYAVRKEFQKSVTPYWSGSAGTIYPVIERLSQRKLIKASSLTDDGRAGKLYTLTVKGKKILKDWLYPDVTSQLVGTPPDPLRSRIEFLELLAPEKRKGFLNEVRDGLEVQLKNAIQKNEENDQSNHFDYLSIRGVILAAQARLDWITEVTEILDKKK
jgi:DNA-binding PadR family transcriptional regulator